VRKKKASMFSGVDESGQPTKPPKNPSFRSDVYSFYPRRQADVEDRERDEDDPDL
jgi:hypothetical protein